jgi:phosphatidylserine/phosphatidylglycerophosphate/cardiolipin synthase-like enzyme
MRPTRFVTIALALLATILAGDAARAQQKAPAWHEDPKLVQRIDALTRTHASSGNSTRLLVNGVQSFAAREKNLEDADAIFLKTFILKNDTTGRATVEKLKSRLQAGAKVFVQFDVKGTSGNVGDWVRIAAGLKQPLPPLLAELEHAGAVVVPTHVPTNLRRIVHGRDHEKYLFTWKKGQAVRLITGGMNVADEYAFGGDPSKTTAYGHGVRDTDIEVVGPEVRDALRGFIAAARRFEHGKGLDQMQHAADEIERDVQAYPIAGGANVRYVANRPSDASNLRNIEKLIHTLLQATPSGETVTMSSAFFLPNSRLVTSIIDAAKRGVRFDLLVNGTRPSWKEFNVVSVAARSLYRHILKNVPAGAVTLYEWLGRPDAGLGPIHQKVFGFGKDGPVIIGSSNMDSQSLDWNTEGVVLVHDEALRKAYDDMFRRDVASSGTHQIKVESLAADPWWHKTLSLGLRRVLGSVL